MHADRVYCWEAFDVTDPLVRAAERLYEQTQHPDERIPWGWIARSVSGRSRWRPGAWGKHLLLAAPASQGDPSGTAGADWKDEPPESATARLAGFSYGVSLPGFGGYVCYIGVADRFRGRGVGTRLFDQMFMVLAADAGASDEPLPFVVWESHRPSPDAPAADWKLWEARIRLFEKVGGLWADGIELLTPNYADPDGPPVALELFVKPVDKPAAAFTPTDLTAVAAGLLERVYRGGPGDPLYDKTVTPAKRPRLRPAKDAGRRPLAGV